MSAAILTIGTELTRGELVDSNSAWLSDRLTGQGMEVLEHISVDDVPDRIAATLRRLSLVHTWVFVTGGLGPTTDDLSALSAARAMGVEVSRRPELIAHLEALYSNRGRSLTEVSRKQADLPLGADVLDNPIGTAPGFSIVLAKCRFFFMPGVPREMKAIFQNVLSTLPAQGGRTQTHLRTYGLPESELGERLHDIETLFPGVTLGYRASFPEVEVKVLADAPTDTEAQALAARASSLVSERLGAFIYGGREDSLAGVTGAALREAGLTLALAESCTGGGLASLLTDVPGSSSFFLLGAVTYANSAKSDILGVAPALIEAHGAVSEEVALAMAQGVMGRASSDLAISVTGIAGPGGGSEHKPVGTVWFGACRGEDHNTICVRFHGDRSRVRRGAAFFALNALKNMAQGLDSKTFFTVG
ncbi:MAG: nicotinamide-nucleotide amidase [Polyangiales bacterium]|jgi:nicotinamide-nucleotide amidase